MFNTYGTNRVFVGVLNEGRWSHLTIMLVAFGHILTIFDGRKLYAKKRRWQRRVYYWTLRLTPWPVYFIDSGMDCDCSQWIRPRRFPNGWAAVRYIKDSYENAEGPQYWERITEDEYLQAIRNGGDRHYDLALEAHENGHPYSVRPH